MDQSERHESLARMSRGARRVRAAGVLLIAYGICGVLAVAISANGWLPDSLDWLAGTVDGVLTLADGSHVAALAAAGRVQVYDADWHFIRGWVVGEMKHRPALEQTGPETFGVFADHRYSGSVSGVLTIGGWSEHGFPQHRERLWIPTSPWLLPLAHPRYAFSVALTGILLAGIAEWLAGRIATDRKRATTWR